MSNYIGPITLDNAHLREGDETKRDGTESINLICSVAQAYQLMGLCEGAVKTNYGPLRVVNGIDSRWGVLPIDTSENLLINEHQSHKGLYQITDLEIEAMGNNPDTVIVHMPVELLTKNINEIFTILYSTGNEDGSDISMSEEYVDETTETILTEPFTTFDTTNVWDAKYSENMAAGADITISSGKLQFTGASATNFTWGYMWTCLKEIVPDEFTAEFTLEWNALPAGGAAHHQINLFLVDGKPANKTELEYKDVIRVVISVESTGATLSVDKRVRGNYSNLSSDIALSSAEKTPAIKLEYSGGSGVSELTVWVDEDYSSGTPSYVKLFGPAKTGVNFDLDRYLILSQENASSTSATTKVAFLDLYTDVAATKPNIVVAPVDAATVPTPDFYRVGEEGSIPCFRSPIIPPTYQIDPDDFYKGSVKAMHSNYTDSVPRLVTSNEFDLDPTKFTLSNGLIKLVPGAQSVAFQYWNGTGWGTLNTFTLPNPIRLIQPFLVEKDRFILQIDRTLWELKSGSYGIWIKHPYNALGYTRKTSCYHDGGLQNGLADGTDVSMLTQFYSLHFTPYNILTENQCGVETNLTGFTAISSTITQESGGIYGKYIKAVTNNATTTEGIMVNMRPIRSYDETALIMVGRALLHGSGTCNIIITERDSAGTAITSSASSVITLNATPTLHNVSIPISSSNIRNVSLQLYTNTKQTATINGDMFQIAPTPLTGANLYTALPSDANRYGMYIVKKDPSTIKTNSIPASDLTGIGVYDQMQPATADDGFLSLSREWFRPTWQKIVLQSEV
jgi:hypothetical protein